MHFSWLSDAHQVCLKSNFSQKKKQPKEKQHISNNIYSENKMQNISVLATLCNISMAELNDHLRQQFQVYRYVISMQYEGSFSHLFKKKCL